MDPRRSPQRIGNAHLADKLAYLRRYRRSPPRRRDFHRQYDLNPARCHLITVSGFTIAKAAQHLRSQTIQAGEYQTVQHPERRPARRFPLQHVKLMTQNRVFSLKRGPRPKRSDQCQPDQATNLSHKAGASPDSISVASKIEFPIGTGRTALNAEPVDPAIRTTHLCHGILECELLVGT